MVKRICTILFFLLPVLWTGIAFASDINFPLLTGRVVDNAHILSSGAIAGLTQELADHEKQTTNQVVVVTLPSLQGQTIEEFGVQLGRHWGIGQKAKDNGVLLIVAPNERKVRIEVGYGLEGTLTDAKSSQIVYGVILPDFRAGKMEQGIVDGTKEILDVLGGHKVTDQLTSQEQLQQALVYTSQAINRDLDHLPPWAAIILGWSMIILFLGMIVLVCVFTVRQIKRDEEYERTHPPTFAGMFFRSVIFIAGGGRFGGGGCSGGW